MKYVLNIKVDILPKTSSNANRNWRGRWAESVKIKNEVAARIPPVLRPQAPLIKAKLTLTRHAFGKRPDHCNLVASFKHVIDALTECRVIKDDDYATIDVPKYNHIPAKPKQGFIEIRVEEVINEEIKEAEKKT